MLLLLVFLPRMESKRSHHYRQWAAQRWVLWRSARAQRWSQKLHFSWQWGGCGEDPVGASGIGMRKRWATSKMISSKNRISWEMVNNFKSMSSIKRLRSERNFSYNQCSKFYWAPTLPTLSWDDKSRSGEIHLWSQNMSAGISVDKRCELNSFTVTNIGSPHKQ